MKLFTAILLLFTYVSCFGQENLVRNGSFEEFEGSKIPMFIEQLTGWKLLKPTEAGYVHPKRQYFTPQKNAFGSQPAKDGEAYIWAKLGGKPIGEYHGFGDVSSTYITAQLIRPMQKGLEYAVSFSVSFADKSNCALDRIGIFISEVEIDTNSYDKNIKFKIPQFKVDSVVNNADEWTEVSGIYIAKGGEQFITIGVFGPSGFVKKKIYARGSHFKEAFYYIDDVKVIEPAQDTLAIEKLFSEQKANSFEQVQFKTGSSELDSVAFPVLDKLASYLQNQKTSVLITGHTDNVGNSVANLVLSQARADAVKAYLVRKGVVHEKLQTNGVGDGQPIVPNDSEVGRKKNRRVVFELLVP